MPSLRKNGQPVTYASVFVKREVLAMIRCPICQADNVVNTLLCRHCGASLIEKADRKTDPLDTKDVGWIGGTTDQQATPSPQPALSPGAIRLKIGVGKREVEVQLDKAILVGRLDPDSNCFPEIDLTEDTIQDRSVSRRHARIYKQDDQVVIEDVGSINGTFVNGQRLGSLIAKTLRDGDTLQLGTVLMEVQFIT